VKIRVSNPLRMQFWGNFPLFEAKFKGAVPVPKQFASELSVVIGSDLVKVGGSKVEILFAARPCCSRYIGNGCVVIYLHGGSIKCSCE
jgi:hypothetical protein